MRVLHICPLEWPVTADSEGPMERALAGLLDALGRLGCESTVLASADSAVAGELIGVVEMGLAGLPPPGLATPAAYTHQIMWAGDHAHSFDVIHCHIPMTGYVLAGQAELRRRLLCTAHGEVNEALTWLVARHPAVAFTSVTARGSVELCRAGAASCEVIPEPTDFRRLALHPRTGDALVFAGELSRRAGVDTAVAVALGLHRRLMLVGPIPAGEESFFRETIEPRLGDMIEHRGDLAHAELHELLASAACALIPGQEETPPLWAIEATARGTPVLALAGATPRDLVEAVEAAVASDRAAVRARAMSRFDANVVAGRYLEVYNQIALADGDERTIAPRLTMARARSGPPRVLQVAPARRPVSLDAPGGIEVLLAHLLPALERHGWESTLLADGGSRVEIAELIPLLSDERVVDLLTGSPDQGEALTAHAVMRAVELGDGFDVIHNYNRQAYLLSAVDSLAGRVVHALQHPVSHSLAWMASQHPQMRFVVPSEFQARKLREAGLASVRVIPNGIDVSGIAFRADPAGKLAFLGAMKPQKGADIALQVAQEVKLPITLAGPIDEAGRAFFDTRVGPLLTDSARYLGVLGSADKAALLREALCLVMPSRWDEPFGMVAIEAMACGTPVVGLANGALPEVVEQGVAGYLATAEEELPELVRRAVRLDRRRVRDYAASRFDVSLTARQCAELYREIAAG